MEYQKPRKNMLHRYSDEVSSICMAQSGNLLCLDHGTMHRRRSLHWCLTCILLRRSNSPLYTFDRPSTFAGSQD
uniref:Uncharacterized protein n=1 Tax=Oryza brachyantha TaxID=4533 RepID=J3MY84_ORYBR